jgi:hypothetical protein
MKEHLMKNLFFLFLLLAIVGCDQSKENWQKAKQTNSISEIKKFLENNPDSKFDIEARHLLDSLEWGKALQSKTIDGFKTFIHNYPNSMNKDIAENILDTLEWKDVLNKNTEESYKAFIKSYPNSRFYSEANSKIPYTFSGIIDVQLKFKNGSGFFADATNEIHFIDVDNCKKYILENRAVNSFEISSDGKPCEIVGYVKGDLIICTSIVTRIDKSLKETIIKKYKTNCGGKENKSDGISVQHKQEVNSK